MKVLEKPTPWIQRGLTLERAHKLADDMVKWNNKEQYDKKWQKRCGDCLAPCCFFPMGGYYYDYLKEKNMKKNESGEMSTFWTHDFVIMSFRTKSWEDLIDLGFDILEQPVEFLERGLQLCPLNVLGNCLIYKDSPKMCKNWRCIMKTNSEVVL